MEAKQCPPQHGSGMAGMKHMLEYVRSNKAPYNIHHVNNSQTFFLPCSLGNLSVRKNGKANGKKNCTSILLQFHGRASLLFHLQGSLHWEEE